MMYTYRLNIFHTNGDPPTHMSSNDLDHIKTMAREITGEPNCQGWELFETATGNMIATSEDREG